MIEIVEVSPRDGLQNESVLLSTETKIELLERAMAAGATRIEAVSFVRPDAVPAMADAEAVMAGVRRDPRVSLIGLVLNRRGLDRAVAAGVDEINIVVPVTDGFARRNQNASAEALMGMAEEVAGRGKEHGLRCSVTLAVAFGCPFDGEVDPGRVIAFGVRAARAGVGELALADTIGVGVPAQVRALVGGLRAALPGDRLPALRMHFHNTRNTGYANAVAAVDLGVTILDASIGGIGGCPFAPRATGNIATEDLVYLLERSGLATGLALDQLIDTAEFLGAKLGRPVPALLPRAGGFAPAS